MINQKSNNQPEDGLECPYCQDQIDNFTSHINGGFRNDKTSSCNECELAIPNKQCISSHTQIVHIDAMKVFSCDICNIDFSSKKYLLIHRNLDLHQKQALQTQNKSQVIKTENEDNLFEDIFEVKEKIFIWHKCLYCKKHFKFAPELQNHIREFHNTNVIQTEEENQNKFVFFGIQKVKLENTLNGDMKEARHQCLYCNNVFRFKSELANHMKELHNTNLQFSCFKCHKRFGTKNDLQKHMATFHKIELVTHKAFLCDACETSFDTEKALVKHLSLVHSFTNSFNDLKTQISKEEIVPHNNKTFKCDACDEAFETDHELKKHLSSVHNFTNKCNKCHKKLKNFTELKKHFEIVHKKVEVGCIQCPKSFENAKKLKQHIAAEHDRIDNLKTEYNGTEMNVSKKIYKCYQCSKPFGKKSMLKAHILSTHGNPSSRYEKVFIDKEPFQKPKAVTQKGKRKYKCNQCEKLLPLQSLKNHVESIHNGIKRYKCDKCEAAYNDTRCLKRHVKEYHNEVQCDEKSIMKHITVYKRTKGISPTLFECNDCKKMFKAKGKVIDHVAAIHLGVKNYKCDKCKKAFGYKDTLKKHIDAVHIKVSVEN